MKFQVYTVEGMGRFPIDMLRKDQSFPYDGTDSAKIEQYSHNVTLREVQLGRYVTSKKEWPDIGRWNSMGWKVIEDSIMTR